jgi:recombination protein RecR
MQYPPWLLDLLPYWGKLPGIGPRSAERFALDLLEWSDDEILQFARLLEEFSKERGACDQCGALAHSEGCPFCGPARDGRVMCVISGQKELYQIEKTGAYRGLYHVLKGPLTLEEDFTIDKEVQRLKERLQAHGVQEVILALEGTLDGDATCHLLREKLNPLNLKLSRIAFGLPIGNSFSSVDGGTLSRSLLLRHSF